MEILRDLKVVELATVLAGPSVGQFFAELGSEVIKVENSTTNGDVTRSWKISGEQTDDRSAYFCSVNWGKKSIAVDLNSEKGLRVVHALISNADIVIASYKPGDAEKLKVDYKTLSALNPRLIYGQITGYGSDNPRVGYDAIVQAEAGFMSMNGEPDGPSLKIPVALIDILAGHHLKEGILLALLNQQRTGQGSLVEVSLIQAAVSSLVNQATNWLVAGRVPTKQGSSHPNIAPYGDLFKTIDGEELLLAVGSDHQFRKLCEILGLDKIASHPHFITNSKRVENREALNSLFKAAISKRTSNELLGQLNKAKVPAGMVKNVQQVFETKEAKELLISSPELLGVRNFAAHLSITDGTHSLLPPPQFGQHTDEILLKLGVSE